MSNDLTITPSSHINVCVVITTFRPDSGFPFRVAQIKKQVACTIIIDDGDCKDNKLKLKDWFGGSSSPSIIIHHNIENLGIAASLNKGIAIAKVNGFSWILILDDDSLVKSNLVEKLINAVNNIKLKKNIGIIGMAWVETNSVVKLNNSRQGILFSEKRGIITSGSFFSLDTYYKVGPFREEFYIDSVDYDYCLRARAMKFAVIELNEVGFEHSLGYHTESNIFGFNIVLNNYKAFRIYYSFRNSTVLALEHLRNDPLYSFAVLKGNLINMFKILLFEKDKSIKMTHILMGLRDALFHNLGKKLNAN